VTSTAHNTPVNGCPVCRATNTAVLLESQQVPVHCNVLWPTRDEAIRAPRGDIRLGFCEECGHIFNLAFDPQLMEYTQVYENSLHFSPRFQQYAKSQAEHLIEQYDLLDKDVIEIGCGKGEFLNLLCELGNNRGVGFDPSYVPDQGEKVSEQVTVIQDFYSERYASYQADLICCRHVLEHIQFPRAFLSTVRRSIGDRFGTIVFFEVPNVMYTLRDLGIWDLIYEHSSYFSTGSLAHLFESCGFEVCHLAEAYDGQYLYIEGLPSKGSPYSFDDFNSDLEQMNSLARTFAEKYRNKVERWQQNLEHIRQTRRRAVVWGGGSKGVTFLNVLKTQGQIACVVDINPRKHGKFIAGTGQKVVSPEYLRDYQPEVVILMNPIYKSEIRRQVANLGLTPEIVVV
jgi:SAM-dependent methyltransferase